MIRSARVASGMIWFDEDGCFRYCGWLRLFAWQILSNDGPNSQCRTFDLCLPGWL